jgi:hypothetical protein
MAWWVAAALAASTRPIVVASGFPAEVEAASGGAVVPRCEPFIEELLVLCLRGRQADREWWVDERDGGWRRLRARAVRASAALAETAGAWVMVEGTSHQFLQVADADGGVAAMLLRPEILAARLGTDELRVAVPNVDVLLAWAGGEPERDMLLAVGAREMFEAQLRPVSPVVLRWDGRAWRAFAVAERP